jgi:geranylgeranyl diphosphate synthase type II
MQNNKYSTLYDLERRKIDLRLKEAFKNRKPASLYNPSAYIVGSPGKRIRPLLVLLSAKATGGKFSDTYNAATAVELLHNFTLVHDDIMDNADTRRGKITLHKKYDNNTAILAGDSLLSVAYEYLLKDCNGNSKRIISSFNKGLVEVCEGQSYDTDFELRRNVSMNEYLKMIGKKTAAMIKMCCEIGVLLANGSDDELSGLSGYGLNLGMAFQIQDDLLDITADEKTLGKRIGGDLIEGKKTFLFVKAIEKSKGEHRKSLIKIIDNKGVKPSEVNKYKILYEKLGVIGDAKARINRYTTKALKSLNVIKKEEDRDVLIWLANSLLRRNK